MSIPARLRHNLPLKLISLIVALVIWGAVHNEADPLITRQQEARVEPINVTSALAVAEVEPVQVTLTLYGRRSALGRLELSDFRMVVNVSGVGVGTVTVPIEAEHLPGGLELRQVSNRMAKVTLDTVVSADKPVFAQLRGEPEAGLAVTETSVRPDVVSVSGPSIEVRKVARVLAALDISTRRESGGVSVNLMALDADNLVVGGVKVTPPEATVTVGLQRVKSRTVPVVPIIGSVPSGYEATEVSAKPAVVTLSGQTRGSSGLESLPTAPVRLRAESGTTEYEATLRVPPGVTVLGTTTVKVRVTLRLAVAPATANPSGATPPPAAKSETPPALPPGQPKPPPAEAAPGGATPPPPSGAEANPTAPAPGATR